MILNPDLYGVNTNKSGFRHYANIQTRDLFWCKTSPGFGTQTSPGLVCVPKSKPGRLSSPGLGFVRAPLSKPGLNKSGPEVRAKPALIQVRVWALRRILNPDLNQPTGPSLTRTYLSPGLGLEPNPKPGLKSADWAILGKAASSLTPASSLDGQSTTIPASVPVVWRAHRSRLLQPPRNVRCVHV